MGAYFLRRLAIAAITVFGVAFVVFSAVRFLPGDTVDVLLQSAGYRDIETRHELEQALGIDRPLLVQFGSWVSDVVRGEFGQSLITQRSIGGDLGSALPVTLELGLLSVAFATVIGVPVGVLSAVKQHSMLDYVMRSTSIVFLSIPNFLLATIIIVFGSVWFNWSPPLRYTPIQDDPIANLEQFLLPAFLLGLTASAGLMRFTRTAVLEVIRQDFVRTARAKGLAEYVTVTRHVLRNAMLPVLTVIGIYLALIVGGSIIFEQIFQLPGIGRYFFNAVAKRDYPGIQAVALIYASIVVIVNLGTDMLYAWSDPRIRYR
ncbi:MAG: ABC transporter permease [Dehalococcoidia bacterium]|nr:ABC transporter permease [Dehalococcoidia bacterium]MCA9845210.1 ABC transporter permease [Dehalococcoidia bacterium]